MQRDNGYKILFSNIGYAKGIDGSLWQHIKFASRHLYCPVPPQQQVMMQLKTLIDQEQPNLCCFVEVDAGSFHSAYFNQIEALIDEAYPFHDVAGKYGADNPLSQLPLHKGKCNALLAQKEVPFDRLYMKHGSKRLLYKIAPYDDVTVFFGHFSLQRKVRQKQFQELGQLAQAAKGEVIILGDFNVFAGFDELAELLRAANLSILNKADEMTFAFHRQQYALDLCLCSRSLQDKIEVRIIDQPYSDHDALVVWINKK
jgi:endonuclease/exonuclease/phosphatase family metal-dependent hydrolase